METDIDFKFGEKTSVYQSCSITFKNQFLVFGGAKGDDRRQISRLSGCDLRRIGTLEFDHQVGACTSVNDEKIYLCFNSNYNAPIGDRKKCRYANKPLAAFTEAASSKHGHIGTSIAASECE